MLPYLPVSDPKAAAHCSAATAAAEPPEDPPGTQAVSHGLRVCYRRSHIGGEEEKKVCDLCGSSETLGQGLGSSAGSLCFTLHTTLNDEFSVELPIPNSSMFVLPIMMAPA